MEEQLREHLMDGEQLLWTGAPEPFETFDRTNRTGIIVGIVIKAIITIALIYCFTFAQDGGSVNLGILAVILVFAALALINPFMIARRLRNRTFYGLTDRRILRCGTFDESVPYERIQSAVLRTDADGRTTLLCGPRVVNLKPGQWRAEADASFINTHDESEAARVILFALPMDDQLRALLEAHIHVS